MSEISSADASTTVEASDPPYCEQAPLPVYGSNECIDGENRVSITPYGTVSGPPEEPGTEGSLSVSCAVQDVQVDGACSETVILLQCEDGRDREVGVELEPGARVDIAPGRTVQYTRDGHSVDECCNWVATRILDGDGLVLAYTVVNGDSTDSDTEHAVELAFASLAGRRSAPICDDGLGNLEYAIELTIADEVVQVPHDSALDVGGYRVLVASARYMVGDADVGFLNEIDAAVVRTPSP